MARRGGTSGASSGLKTPLLLPALGSGPVVPPQRGLSCLPGAMFLRMLGVKAKSLCSSPVPVTPVCCCSSVLTSTPCPSPIYAPFSPFLLVPPRLCMVPQCVVPWFALSRLMDSGRGKAGRLLVCLWVWFGFFPCVGPLATFLGDKYCWLGPCEESLCHAEAHCPFRP